METYNLTTFEKELWSKGLEYVAGIDEVGRGSLAGPMVVCATILNKEHIQDIDNLADEHRIYSDIKDSKLLTPKKRLNIRDYVINEVISYSLIEVPHYKIDSDGITQCTKEAFYLAVKKLNVKPHHVLTDNYGIARVAFYCGSKPGIASPAKAIAAGLTGSPINFNISVAELAKFEYVDGDSQAGTVGSVLPKPLKAKIVDQRGKPIPISER